MFDCICFTNSSIDLFITVYNKRLLIKDTYLGSLEWLYIQVGLYQNNKRKNYVTNKMHMNCSEEL
jgi:hypothetical protein